MFYYNYMCVILLPRLLHLHNKFKIFEHTLNILLLQYEYHTRVLGGQETFETLGALCKLVMRKNALHRRITCFQLSATAKDDRRAVNNSSGSNDSSSGSNKKPKTTIAHFNE